MTRLADLKPKPMNPAERYDTAQAIQQANPDWLVMWGVYTRQYVAFPLFRARDGYIMQPANPDELLLRMRQAEFAFTSGQARRDRRTEPSRAMHHKDAAGWHGGETPNP